MQQTDAAFYALMGEKLMRRTLKGRVPVVEKSLDALDAMLRGEKYTGKLSPRIRRGLEAIAAQYGDAFRAEEAAVAEHQRFQAHAANVDRDYQHGLSVAHQQELGGMATPGQHELDIGVGEDFGAPMAAGGASPLEPDLSAAMPGMHPDEYEMAGMADDVPNDAPPVGDWSMGRGAPQWLDAGGLARQHEEQQAQYDAAAAEREALLNRGIGDRALGAAGTAAATLTAPFGASPGDVLSGMGMGREGRELDASVGRFYEANKGPLDAMAAAGEVALAVGGPAGRVPGLGGIAPAVHRARAFTRKAPKPLPPAAPRPRRGPWPTRDLKDTFNQTRRQRQPQPPAPSPLGRGDLYTVKGFEPTPREMQGPLRDVPPAEPPKPPSGPLGSPGPVAETAPGFLREPGYQPKDIQKPRGRGYLDDPDTFYEDLYEGDPLPGYLRDVSVDPNGYVRNSKGQWVDARTRRIATELERRKPRGPLTPEEPKGAGSGRKAPKRRK